jgi:hypothetical protein
MGLMTSIALGAGLGAGMLLGRKRGKGQQQAYTPPAYPGSLAEGTSGESMARARTLVASTDPPDVVQATSENTAQAGLVAAKRRRRAAAGSAGRVTTGPASPGQRTVRAAGTAPSLLGY